MATFLLTTANIDFLKAALRKSFPQIKSAHLTEALAFGAGYNTHAAMLASLRACPSQWPIVVEIDDERIANRLCAFGYERLAVSTADVIHSPTLPERIWVAFESGDIDANNRWFRECQQRNIPNLRIERRKKFVELSWDCISIDTRNDAHVRDEAGDALMREMFSTYQRIARCIPGKSEFCGSSFVGSVVRLWPELAYELADEFFAMLYDPMRAQPMAA